MLNLQHYADNVNESATFIAARAQRPINVLILAGTGLGDAVKFENEPLILPYAEIPHFPQSTVKSHKGEFAFGEACGLHCAVMRGRFHLYEGYAPTEVVYPVRVMQVLGVKNMVVTNAAGGITPRFRSGDIMALSDHINLTGENPLAGAYSENWGEMFVDMAEAYDVVLRRAAIKAYQQEYKDELKSGVYAGLKGPSLETPAEIAFLKTIGADAVGLSTVTEVIAARQAKMRVFGVSAITNSHVPGSRTSANLDDVIAQARECAPKVHTAIRGVLEALALKR